MGGSKIDSLNFYPMVILMLGPFEVPVPADDAHLVATLREGLSLAEDPGVRVKAVGEKHEHLFGHVFTPGKRFSFPSTVDI